MEKRKVDGMMRYGVSDISIGNAIIIILFEKKKTSRKLKFVQRYNVDKKQLWND